MLRRQVSFAKSLCKIVSGTFITLKMKAATILAVLVALIALFAGASAEYFDFVASKAFVLSMQKVRFFVD